MDAWLEGIKKKRFADKQDPEFVSKDDFRYVIQRAEEAQELEKDLQYKQRAFDEVLDKNYSLIIERDNHFYENQRYKSAFKTINNAFNNDQVDNELFIAEVEDVLISLKQNGMLADGF